jgi:hypothetical protein
MHPSNIHSNVNVISLNSEESSILNNTDFDFTILESTFLFTPKSFSVLKDLNLPIDTFFELNQSQFQCNRFYSLMLFPWISSFWHNRENHFQIENLDEDRISLFRDIFKAVQFSKIPCFSSHDKMKIKEISQLTNSPILKFFPSRLDLQSSFKFKIKIPCFPSVFSSKYVTFLYCCKICQLPFEYACILCPNLLQTNRFLISLIPPFDENLKLYKECLNSLFNAFQFIPFQINNNNGHCFHFIGKQLGQPDLIEFSSLYQKKNKISPFPANDIAPDFSTFLTFQLQMIVNFQNLLLSSKIEETKSLMSHSILLYSKISLSIDIFHEGLWASFKRPKQYDKIENYYYCQYFDLQK